MTDLWIAFTLGLFGSLHCAGMCGPLALSLPRQSGNRSAFLAGRLAYNAGRTITYGIIGGLFGLAGQTMILAGAQRWLSIGLGLALLVGWFVSKSTGFAKPVTLLAGKLGSRMSPWMRRNSFSGLGILGLLNGLLPCGLVYVAAAGAAATGSLVSGAAYMVIFGLGTIPMLLAISLSGSLVPVNVRLKLVKAIPVTVVLLAALLILRGMSLGIPYISPDLSATESCCHPSTD